MWVAKHTKGRTAVDKFESLSQITSIHIVFMPKCRRKTFYVQFRKYPRKVSRNLIQKKEYTEVDGHFMANHLHTMLPVDGNLMKVTQNGRK